MPPQHSPIFWAALPYSLANGDQRLATHPIAFKSFIVRLRVREPLAILDDVPVAVRGHASL